MEPPVRWQSAMLYFNDRSRVSIKIKDTKMEQITTLGCGARCREGRGGKDKKKCRSSCMFVRPFGTYTWEL